MTSKFRISIVCCLFVAVIATPTIADEAAERAARAQQFLAKAQRICPVTGKELDSMGEPFKAEVDGQTVFLCCKGCVGRQMNPQHWATVQRNLHMAHLALAQEICPVMGKDLLSMGGPVPAEVDGQTVFLCCKGCLKKPVEPAYVAQIRANRIAAQGACPVMGKPLPEDATSVVVKGQEVFVCCPRCAAKIEAEPDKYLAAVHSLLSQNLTKLAQREVALESR